MSNSAEAQDFTEDTLYEEFGSDDDKSTDDCREVSVEVGDENGTFENVPKVGMTFQSEQDAYDFYNAYAGRLGFSIRKCHTKKRADKTLCAKHLVCSNEGKKSTHPTHETKKERASTRSSCKAFVRFTVSREGLWTVRKVELNHNHALVSPNKSHMLRSQRHIEDGDKHIIKKMREAGIKSSDIYSFFEPWLGGDQNVTFLPMDCNNYITREPKKYLEAKEAQTLLNYLENKQSQDPSFFYALQLDKVDGRVASFFWADGQSISDYACFGDVLSIDTTFQTNKSEMPFAPILGTNHHKQTILFGAALLFDECDESIFWLFSTFLKAMSGKQPTTIFTDQCASIAKTIRMVFPNTSHRLCLWHIYQNAAKHLSHVIAGHTEFLSDFKSCVYEDRSVDHFNMKWQQLLSTYNLEDNSWIQNLFSLREKWATVYRRDSFCADMTSTQRSEVMNNVFKKTFRRKLSISELLVQYDKCNARLRRDEFYEDFKSRDSNPNPYVSSLPLLKTAAEAYTRSLFADFEDEFKGQFPLSCTLTQHEGVNSTFMVTNCNHAEDEAIVAFNSDSMESSCSCQKYTCSGILCKHILRVFNFKNIFILPPQYILSRWTKYAKRGSLITTSPTKVESLEARCAIISRKAISIGLKCGVSKELVDRFEVCIDKVGGEIEDLLGKISLDCDEPPHCTLECNKDVGKTWISFRAPSHKKGPKASKKPQKRGKDQKPFENSENTFADVPSQSSTGPSQETLRTNTHAAMTIPTWANAMSSLDSSRTFFPTI